MLVAFELYDSIDDVLEYLRACQRTFFGDVTYQYDRHARGFSKAE